MSKDLPTLFVHLLISLIRSIRFTHPSMCSFSSMRRYVTIPRPFRFYTNCLQFKILCFANDMLSTSTFLTATCDIFQAMTWYKRSLNFIPNSLCNLAMETNPDEVSFLSAPPDWKYSVRTFLKKHPAPKEDPVAILDKNAPREIDIATRTKGRKLANRYL